MKKQEHHPIIQVHNLTKVYTAGDVTFLALKDIEVDIEAGEFLGITGKSGAGKTTLLNMISGVSQPTSGEVHYFGHHNGNSRVIENPIQVHALSEDELAGWRGENLGIIYQSFELMPTLNLIENVMLPPDFTGSYSPITSKERALELLDMVDIVEHAYKIPAHISGGQKQRVAIARALVNDPPLIVADEPTGNLDTVTAETILQIFEGLIARGKTIIMVTHDESLAPRFSRRLHIIDGELSAPGKNGKLIASNRAHDSERAAEFTGQIIAQSASGVRSPSEELIPGRLDERASSDGSTKTHPAILLKAVEKVYENAAGRFPALKSIDLQLNYGQ